MATITNFTLYSEYILVGVMQRNSVNDLFSNYICTELYRQFPNSLQ